MDPVDVARVEADRVAGLGRRVAELEEVVGHLGRASHLARALEAEDEDVEDEAVVLETGKGQYEQKSKRREEEDVPGR